MTEKINRILPEGVDAGLRVDEMLASHTTFAVGGPADLWLSPRLLGAASGAPSLGDALNPLEAFLSRLLPLLREEGVPLTILGGGANVVVSDRGIRGLVLDTAGLDGMVFEEAPADSLHRPSLFLGAGLPVDRAVDETLERGFCGLAFLAGMPGSVGGAVWMNARCYGSSISDILLETRYLDEEGRLAVLPFDPAHFDYKKSPFQGTGRLILGARFRIAPGDRALLSREAADHRADRAQKGHFRLPSAGSSFKNDHRFGKPSGMLIDECGLRGLSVGGAQVAPWHGNIIVNSSSATATDIRALADLVKERVLDATGFVLECEMLFVGDWP